MPKHDNGPYLYSVFEVASRLDLSEETVRRFIRHGELKSVRLGRRVLVHPGDLDAFIDARRGTTTV